MALWKITDQGPDKVKETKFKKEKLLEEHLADKLGMPSSVFVKNRNPTSDRIRLRAKEDFDVKSESFVKFLREAFKAFPK